MSKYEIVPGLFVGSEIGDINRQIKENIRLYIEGDKQALYKVVELQHQRTELLISKKLKMRKK